MIVQCGTLDEFIECLTAEECLFQNVVRVDVSRRALDSGPEHVSFAVTFQATTVVIVREESQYLLQVGVDCGKDYEDASEEREGTDVADRLKSRLEQYVNSRGWKILPGIINI